MICVMCGVNNHFETTIPPCVVQLDLVYMCIHFSYFRDSLIVSLGNCMTSIFGGFVIFSYIGYMAGQLQTEVGKVATHGKYLSASL